MKKSRKILFTLLAALLVFCVVFAVACEPPTEEEEPDNSATTSTVQENAIVSNGTFATATGASSAYVKTNVTGWSISTDGGSWLNTTAGLVYGVVDLDSDKFNTNKNAVNASVDYPGIAPNTPKDENGAYKDTNALVISMANSEQYGSIYYSISKNVSLSAKKYYKLSIDVWTDLLFNDGDSTPERGASIAVGGDVFTEYLSINTEKRWRTYEVYIQGNDFESRSMSLQLWLGHGPSTLYKDGNTSEKKDNPYLAKGTVMFDNITITELDVEKQEGKTACPAYEAALNANFAALCPEAAQVSTDKSRVLGLAAKNAENGNISTVISLVYPDQNFTAYMPYDAHSTNTSYIKNYYTAKVGDAENYTWILGKENLTDSSKFPTYTTIGTSYKNASSDPRGIFDMSKLYRFDADANGDLTPVDTFNKINANFHAPEVSDFYNVNGDFILSNGANPLDTKALLIYHTTNKTSSTVNASERYPISGAGYVSDYNLRIESNKYYEISVWAYIWVPSYEAPVAPTEVAAPAQEGEPKKDDYDTDEAYNTAKKEYDDYQAYLVKYDEYSKELAAYKNYMRYIRPETDEGGNEVASQKPVYATFRLSGSTTDTKIEEKTDGTWGTWQKITLRVKGNELADRQLRMEFWYGEGEWESETLYPGGCFFDNVTIKVTDEPEAGQAYKPLAVINTEDYDKFNLTPATARGEFTAITAEGIDGWTYEPVDKRTAPESVKVGFIGGNFADSTVPYTAAELAGIIAPGTFELGSKKFDVIMLNHSDYTASTLTFMPEGDFMTVSPNKFYRLSMWVNTQNLAGGSNFKVSVYDQDKKDTVSSSAIVSSIAVKEWTEISILIKGGSDKSNKLYLYFEYGSGNIYTPASHTKGAIFITACTYAEIDYDEYSKATTGTYVKKATVSDDTLSSNTVTSDIANSGFTSISDSDYNDKDKVKEIFSDEGDIVGVATPTSWTSTDSSSTVSATHALSAVSVKASGTKLTWKEVTPEANIYYVFMKEFKNADETEKNVLVGKLLREEGVEDSSGVKEFTYEATANGTYYVHAIAEVGGKTYTSIKSSEVSVTGVIGSGTYQKHADHDSVKALFDSAKFGVINAEKYKGTGLGDDFYADGDRGYRSTASDNLLMITSGFETYIGYKSTSSTLSTDSYYRLSVWVKTVDGAKASVTLANNSNSLSINREYPEYNMKDEADKAMFKDHIGYLNIDTEGKWVRYDFYIATNMSGATVNLELCLGTRYANKELALSSSEKATKVSYGLSHGTVYFDDVMLTKLSDEKAYNKLVYGIEDIDLSGAEIAEILENDYATVTPAEDVNALTVDKILEKRENVITALDESMSFFTNNYIFRIVNYYVNSFDNHDEDISEDSKLGAKPNSYTHRDAYSATAGTDKEPNIIYGVYDKTKIEDAFVSYICTDGYALATYGEDKIASFLRNVGEEGNNKYLMLANVQEATGQYYQSNAISMSSESLYKITFKAKLLSVGDKKAEFRLVYDNSNNYWETLAIDPSADNEMLDYTFYYYNESKSSVSIYLNFTLGSNDAQGSDDRVKNDVAGILIIDDVSINKLATSEAAATAYEDALADTSAVRTGNYKTEASKSDDGDKDGDEPDKEENGKKEKEVDPQVWLIVSSVLIGVILIAVVVVLIYRKLKGRVVKKLRKTKVESNVPVDLEQRSNKPKIKGESRKTNIDSNEYDD